MQRLQGGKYSRIVFGIRKPSSTPQVFGVDMDVWLERGGAELRVEGLQLRHGFCQARAVAIAGKDGQRWVGKGWGGRGPWQAGVLAGSKGPQRG